MNSEIIKQIEVQRNKLRKRIMSKRFFSTKLEKQLLDKYEELLLKQYAKFIQ